MSEITVIGAAIAGPAAALALARNGHNVTVYESRPADALFSAGILGITPNLWTMLDSYQVDTEPYQLSNDFTDYKTGERGYSPFHYITWTGLHNALVSEAEKYGTRFVYGHHIDNPERIDGITVDATGIAGAARKNLPHVYSRHTIYRGLSRRFVNAGFIAYREQPGTYFTVGDTPDGAFWAYFVPRFRTPSFLATTDVKEPPKEYESLPAEFRAVVLQTDRIARTPLSDWTVPHAMLQGNVYSVGDVNGPVRPVTTSGANLAMMEGFAMPELLTATPSGQRMLEMSMLHRRAYDLKLGQELEGPEIGGQIEDIAYSLHHRMLFGRQYA